ncbi:MAG: hypothetical protein AAGJ09_01070 [Pseudomonadota bacterium]
MDTASRLRPRRTKMNSTIKIFLAANAIILILGALFSVMYLASDETHIVDNFIDRNLSDDSLDQAINTIKSRPQALKKIALFNPARSYPQVEKYVPQEAAPASGQSSSFAPVPKINGVILSGDGSLALIFDETATAQSWLQIGSAHNGWTLVSVTENMATWSRDGVEQSTSVRGTDK